MKDLSLQNARIVLVDSKDCFCIPYASVVRDRGKSRPSNASLPFLLEKCLPMDAEEMAICIPKAGRQKVGTLCFVVQRSQVQSQIDDAENQGQWIVAIVPQALLAVQSWIQDGSTPRECRLAWQSNCREWDLFDIQEGTIHGWRWADLDGATDWLSNDGVGHTQLTPMSGERIALVTSESDRFGISDSASRVEVLSQTAAIHRIENKIRVGQLKPWLDFRQSALSVRQRWLPIAKTLGLCLSVLTVALASLLVWQIGQISQWQKLDQDSQSRQQTLFAGLYPNQRIPNDIPGRLASEHRKLKKENDELKSVPRIASTLEVTTRFLTTLPDDAMFRVDSLVVQESLIAQVTGAAAKLEDFERIVQSLQENGFSFSPPSTNQMSDGYSMQIENMRFTETPIQGERE
jgi:type II secretory pathway component PulL